MEELSSSKITYRVYFKDTDAGGIMYHAKYIELMEIGRIELFRQRGISISELLEKKILFPIYEIKINYFKPAFLDDLLDIKVHIDKIKGSKLYCSYQVNNSSGDTLIKASSINACVTLPNLIPVRATRFLGKLSP